MISSSRIKDLRKEMNYSQQELGDAIGVTKVSICGYENGTRTPSLDTFVMLAELFETSTDYLLGRTDEKNNEKVALSKEDYQIVKELKNSNSSLYTKLLKDPKRYVSLIFKKLK